MSDIKTPCASCSSNVVTSGGAAEEEMMSVEMRPAGAEVRLDYICSQAVIGIGPF